MPLHVTNIKGTFADGRESEGFYMDGYLCANLLGIPAYLKKKWDVVCIVSGHGKVRVGKSTMAFQTASFIAWLLAGGRIKMEIVKNEYGKTGWKVNKVKQPTRPMKFSLKDNVVFSALDLKKTAVHLFETLGPNQPIIYDEAREGLEGARAMENLNKVMQDFFQECGYMGHIIILVLPNYFKLHEDYSVSRSLFLIDTYHDKRKRRGFFNFYNETDKEWLYFLGKKKIGISQKYRSARPSFFGRFTSWFPFDRKEYEDMKSEALKKRAKTKREKQYQEQRNALIYVLKRDERVTFEKMVVLIEKLVNERVNVDTIARGYDIVEKKLKNIDDSSDD